MQRKIFQCMALCIFFMQNKISMFLLVLGLKCDNVTQACFYEIPLWILRSVSQSNTQHSSWPHSRWTRAFVPAFVWNRNRLWIAIEDVFSEASFEGSFFVSLWEFEWYWEERASALSRLIWRLVGLWPKLMSAKRLWLTDKNSEVWRGQMTAIMSLTTLKATSHPDPAGQNQPKAVKQSQPGTGQL